MTFLMENIRVSYYIRYVSKVLTIAQRNPPEPIGVLSVERDRWEKRVERFKHSNAIGRKHHSCLSLSKMSIPVAQQ